MFGLLHAVTPLYLVWATLAGALLGTFGDTAMQMWRINAAVSPCPPISLDTVVARTEGMRREILGGVHRSRAISVAPCQTLIVRFATFSSLCRVGVHRYWQSARGGVDTRAVRLPRVRVAGASVEGAGKSGSTQVAEEVVVMIIMLSKTHAEGLRPPSTARRLCPPVAKRRPGRSKANRSANRPDLASGLWRDFMADKVRGPSAPGGTQDDAMPTKPHPSQQAADLPSRPGTTAMANPLLGLEEAPEKVKLPNMSQVRRQPTQFGPSVVLPCYRRMRMDAVGSGGEGEGEVHRVGTYVRVYAPLLHPRALSGASNTDSHANHSKLSKSSRVPSWVCWRAH